MKTDGMTIFLAVLAAVIFAACLVMLVCFGCPWWTFLITAVYYGAISIAIVKFIRKAWLSVVCIVLLMVLSLLMCSSTRGLSFDVPPLAALVENSFSSSPGSSAGKAEDESSPLPLSGREMSAPSGFTRTLIDLPNCTMELLAPSRGSHERVIYQLHGGSYVDRLGDIHRDNALLLSKYSDGADVASLDYRTASAVSYQYILDDAMAGYCALAEAYGACGILICGDSAGGGLSLALTMALIQEGFELPSGTAVMCPWADLTTGIIPSPFSAEDDVSSPLISPALGDYTGFPPLLIQTGLDDLIHSDSVKVRDRALACGADVMYCEYENMSHDFQLFLGDQSPCGKAAWEQFSEFADKCFS